MKRTVLALFLIVPSLILVGAQNATQMEALEGAVTPEAMQSLPSAAASAGIVINPPAVASLSETTQLLTAAAAARGLPIQAQGIQNIVTRGATVHAQFTVIR